MCQWQKRGDISPCSSDLPATAPIPCIATAEGTELAHYTSVGPDSGKSDTELSLINILYTEAFLGEWKS